MALYEAISRRDPRLSHPASAGGLRLGARRGGPEQFLGRADELAQVVGHVQTAVASSLSVLVVQGEASLPLFVGSLQASMRKVVTQPPLDPGDVIIHNHPEVGGTHVQKYFSTTCANFGACGVVGKCSTWWASVCQPIRSR